MRRPFLLLLLVGVLVAALAPAAAGSTDPPASSPLLGKWERLSPSPNVAHEVQVFRRTGDEWVSIYRWKNDPRLGEPQPISATLGEFRGVEVDVSTVDCSPSACPANMTFALSGTWTVFRLSEEPIPVPVQVVTTESGMAWWIALGDFSPSLIYRVSCPWYTDFDAALAANPDFANPDLAFDCFQAVEEPPGNLVYSFSPEEKNCTDGYDNDGDGPVDEADPDCAG